MDPVDELRMVIENADRRFYLKLTAIICTAVVLCVACICAQAVLRDRAFVEHGYVEVPNVSTSVHWGKP